MSIFPEPVMIKNTNPVYMFAALAFITTYSSDVNKYA